MIRMIKDIKLWKWVDYVVWSLPLLALVLSLYVIVDYYASRDIHLRIVFSDASSIEPQKTQLVYKGIVVGVVEGVSLDTKSNNVVVRASLDREAKELAVEGTRFQIIQPKVGFSGISGLETLLKGTYIKIEKRELGSKKKKTEFIGMTSDDGDIHDAKIFVLRAKHGRGLSIGMPIEFKGIKIGSVVGIDFEGLNTNEAFKPQDILVKIGIENKYSQIINEQSYFWKHSAIDAKIGMNGFNFEISSLEALLKGSIRVDGFDLNSEPIEAGYQFTLHDKMIIKRSPENEPKLFQLMTNDAESIQKNDPVFYRGIQTGSVNNVSLKANGKAIVQLSINANYKHMVRANTVFWRKSAVDSKLGWSGLSLKVSSLESLVKGGINFATPTELAQEATAGTIFALKDNEPDSDWKNWSPQFPQKEKQNIERRTSLSLNDE